MAFFDIHTHIVPGIDDGSKSEEMTLEMLKKSYESGVDNIILTPHYNEPHRITAIISPELLEHMRKLAAQVSENIRIFAGNEIFFTNNTKSLLLNKKAASLAGSNYVLLEFHYGVSSGELISAVNEVRMCGYWPILAHVERYDCIHEKGLPERLVSAGAYLQMNAGFIISANFRANRFISKLIKENLISFIGSDCHNVTSRAPNMGECINLLNKKFGSEITEFLLMRNPEKIIKNERL